MRSLKAKLKRPNASSTGNKEEWSKLDQRVWHSVAVNQPAKLASKFSKYHNINVNKICPSVGYSVVHYAAAKGLDDCLNVLLAHNANSNNRDVTGATPLHASARYGHKGTTSKILATCTVDVNAHDDNQCTALHFSAFEGHLDCVKLVANDKKCNIHCIDKDGRTALMVAAAMGRLSVCEELIKRGINVNHQDTSSLQHTALTLAAEAGHADVVKLLCDNDANYNLKLSDGRSALDVARNRSRRSVVDALHVIQLTQAAKSTTPDSNPDSKTTVKKFEDKLKSAFHSEAKGNNEAKAENVPSSRNLPSSVQVEKVADRGSPSDRQGGATDMLPLYNDAKHGQLYDRDVSLYDSKSTLASMSSLDVSSVIDTSRISQAESPATPQMRGARDAGVAKHVGKLTEELALKEEQMKELEKRFHEQVSVSKREIDSLKSSNAKYEQSVQELEKANDLLSTDYLQLEREKKEAAHRFERLQGSCEESQAALKSHEKNHREKILKLEERGKAAAIELERLTREKTEAIGDCEKAMTKWRESQSELNHLLATLGLANNHDDHIDSARLLQSEIALLQEKNAKKVDQEKLLLQENERLENELSERDDTIQTLKRNLSKSDKQCEDVKRENDFLVDARKLLQERLQKSEESNNKYVTSVTQLQQAILDLNEQLESERSNRHEKNLLEEKLQMSFSVSEKAAEEYDRDRLQWKHKEATLEEKLNEVSQKYNDAKKDEAEQEKVISKLRAERNQREAVLSRFEKDVAELENRRKEVEVESNRTRQQLTESRQKCAKLECDLANLLKSKKEVTMKLNAIKLNGNTEVERKKIDSMNVQLESLCKHLQESEKKYNETISAYRSHLLMAAKGELNPDVLNPLREILKLLEKPHARD